MLIESFDDNIQENQAPLEKYIEELNSEIKKRFSPTAELKLQIMEGNYAENVFGEFKQASNMFLDYWYHFQNYDALARIGMVSYSMSYPLYFKSRIQFDYGDNNVIEDIVEISNESELKTYIKCMFNCAYMKRLFIMTKIGDIPKGRSAPLRNASRAGTGNRSLKIKKQTTVRKPKK